MFRRKLFEGKPSTSLQVLKFFCKDKKPLLFGYKFNSGDSTSLKLLRENSEKEISQKVWHIYSLEDGANNKFIVAKGILKKSIFYKKWNIAAKLSKKGTNSDAKIKRT
eukprot:GHVP01052938.1.p1 GENE.GHVP01052938.1~~GHVP01052938.1.p1  ORF type:complete len:108 (+),score=13.79 GHVP01052938.1:624-947(+)